MAAIELEDLAEKPKPQVCKWGLAENSSHVSTKEPLKYLSFLGVMNVTEYNFKYKNLYRLSIWIRKLILYIYYPISFIICLTHLIHDDAAAFFIMFQTVFNLFGGPLKALCCQLMVKNLRKAHTILDKLDARCQDSDEIDEQKKAVEITRKTFMCMVAVYYIYCTFTYGSYCINQYPPCTARVPIIDYRRSTVELHTTQAIEFTVILSFIAQQVVNDGYAAMYVSLLGGHMRILLLRVSKLGKRKELTSQENVDALKLCIQDYHLILAFKDLISPIISKTILMQYIIMALTFATTLINLMFFTTNTGDRIGSLILLLGCGLQCFPTCYFCTQLEVESGRLSTEIFGSFWVDQNREYRLIILNFMHHAQEEIRFSAGKIFSISLEMFVSVSRFSFSIYTFVSNIDVKARFNL